MSLPHLTAFDSAYAIHPDLLNLLLADGWTDDSSGNDVCPSLVRGIHRLWCDHPVRAQREYPGDRYVMTVFDDDTGETAVLWTCESAATAISYLMTH